MSAVLSDCGSYRFELHRNLSGIGSMASCFVMLNPSTADATKNDPTIRKCIGFSMRWGCTSLHVVNLFAIRSTDPRGIMKSPEPVGDENDLYIIRNAMIAQKSFGPVVLAWGNHGRHAGRGAEVAKLLRNAGIDVKCFGKTKVGEPKHPLHLSYKTELVRYV